MKIVLDTNVLVSAFFPSRSPPMQTLDLFLEGKIEIVYSLPILEEYINVLFRPKFTFDHQRIGAILDLIEKDGVVVVPAPLKVDLADKDDLAFLEAAVSSRADFLVTGNLRHFPFHSFKNVKVVSPAKFIEFYLKKRG